MDAQRSGAPPEVHTIMPEPNQPLRQLTEDDVRKLVTVEAQILTIVRAARESGVSGARLDSPDGVASASSALDASPEASRVLSTVGWTGRDFWLTFLATSAAITGELPFGLVSGSAWSANRKLIDNLPNELAERFAEWKRVRFGPD